MAMNGMRYVPIGPLPTPVHVSRHRPLHGPGDAELAELAASPIPLGRSFDGGTVLWDYRDDSAEPESVNGDGEYGESAWVFHGSHMLVTGAIGGGKTTVLRDIAKHALAHGDDVDLRVFGIDNGLGNDKLTAAWLGVRVPDERWGSVVDLSRELEALRDETVGRLVREEDGSEAPDEETLAGRSLPEGDGARPRSIIAIVDILAGNDSLGPTDKESMLARKSMRASIASLLRLGAAADVHLVLSVRVPTSKTMTGIPKEKFTVRLACGRLTRQASMLTFGDVTGMSIPVGQGYAAIAAMPEGVAPANVEPMFLRTYYPHEPEARPAVGHDAKRAADTAHTSEHHAKTMAKIGAGAAGIAAASALVALLRNRK